MSDVVVLEELLVGEVPCGGVVDVGDDASWGGGECDDASGEEEGLVEVVGDEDDGSVLAGVFVEFTEEVLEEGAVDGVKGTEGFVHEEDGCGECECPCDGGALSHASGEFLGEASGGVGESDGGEVVIGECGEFASWAVGVGGLESEDEVFGGGHPGEEGVVLEDDGAVSVGSVDVVGVDGDVSCGWPFESGDESEEG